MTTNAPSTQEAAFPTPFDTSAFLAHLDHLFATKQATTAAEPYMLDCLDQVRAAENRGAELTILNELMGFYRSQSMHDKGLAATRTALDLVRTLGIEGTEAATTTLINAATAYRAAGDSGTALKIYKEALDQSARTLSPTDRKLAALHNNLSIAYSDTQHYSAAQRELETALEILTDSSPDPSTDIDIGSTHANLALVCYRAGQPEIASAHVSAAMRIFAAGKHEDASHFSSALAAAGEAFFHMGKYSESEEAYGKALDLIARSYGTDNDYYSITAQNLAAVTEAAQEEVRAAAQETADSADAATSAAPNAQSTQKPSTAHPQNREELSGLELSRRYWEECGKPMLAAKYPELRLRVAAGLVGHGSEVYGFDDAFSRDHDFAPRFCLWLTPADFALYGEQLQRDYDALPTDFLGYTRAGIERTPRAQGGAKRDGVFSIPDFYRDITGYDSAPGSTNGECQDEAADTNAAMQWLLLDEATLAAATNGAVFADPLGAFSRQRRLFKAMPEEVRLSLISRRLGMIAQAGQYNFPRMVARGQSEGAWRALNEFVHASASLVFLLNSPSAAGYLPYYKWEMAALHRLSRRMGAKLAGVAPLLRRIMETASRACFDTSTDSPRAALGDYETPHSRSADTVMDTITTLCGLIRDELLNEGLTTSTETFLEWQRPYVEEHITNPQLRSL